MRLETNEGMRVKKISLSLVEVARQEGFCAGGGDGSLTNTPTHEERSGKKCVKNHMFWELSNNSAVSDLTQYWTIFTH